MLAPLVEYESMMGHRACDVGLSRRIVLDPVRVGSDLSSFNSCVVVWWRVQNGTVELVAHWVPILQSGVSSGDGLSERTGVQASDVTKATCLCFRMVGVCGRILKVNWSCGAL